MSERYLVLPWTTPADTQHGGRLTNFQYTLIQGWLAKLNLLGDWPVVDWTQKVQPFTVGQSLRSSFVMDTLQRICQSRQAAGAITGEITVDCKEANANQIKTVHCHWYWFNAQYNEYQLIQSFPISQFEPGRDTFNNLAPTPEELNAVLNWFSFHSVLHLKPSLSTELMGVMSGQRFVNHYNTLQQWVDAKQTKSFATRLALFEQISQQDPRFEPAIQQLGRLYKQQRDYVKAIDNYQKAIAVSQASDNVRSNYAIEAGICAALEGDKEQAIQLWLKATALQPNSLKPYMNIAHMYEELNDLEQAERFFRKAQVLAPQDSRLYYNLARVYSRQQQWGKALAQYQLQLVVDQKDPWCHSNIATCYLQLGDEQNAKTHLEHTVELDATGEAGQYANLILAGILT